MQADEAGEAAQGRVGRGLPRGQIENARAIFRKNEHLTMGDRGDGDAKNRCVMQRAPMVRSSRNDRRQRREAGENP